MQRAPTPWQRFRPLLPALLLLVCLESAAQPVAPPPDPVAAAEPTPEERMYQARNLGLRAVETGVYTSAIVFFTEYRRLAGPAEPQFADATVHLVRACLLDGKPEQADEALAFHRQNSPGLADAYYQNALAYSQAATLLARNEAKLATEQATALLKPGLDPEYRRMTLRLIADAQVKQDRWPEAEETLRAILREFPLAKSLLEVRQLLVRACIANGKFAEAEALLAEIPRLHPDVPASEIGRLRTQILAHMGKLDEALATYRTVSSDRPRRPDAAWWLTAFHLGGTLFQAKRFEEALIVLPDAVGLAVNETDRVQTMLAVAECQIALERTALAIDTLEKFRRDYPERQEIVPVILKLAELLRSTQNYLTAGDYFGQVMDNEKAPPGFRYRASISRGWCFRDAGQFDQAIATFAAGENLGVTPSQKAQSLTLAGDTAYHVKNYLQAAEFFGYVADRYPTSDQAARGRLLEARSRFEAKLFDQAADSYQRFLADFPQSDDAEIAELEWGIAQRHGANNAGEHAQALDTLRAFLARHPQSAAVPRALMEAASAAEGAEKILDAILVLGTLIDDHPESELFPQAIYQRTRLHFFQADFAKAVADATLFLDKFPLLPLAVDILTWLGDYYANTEDYEKALDCFAQIHAQHALSPQAPTALYEAAYCAYQLQQFPTVHAMLANLRTMTNPKPTDQILARAELLEGDILSRDGQYAEAIRFFARARELAGNTAVGIAALGRQGEMFYSLAASDQAKLADAIACFKAILDTPGVSADAKELATYRLAKCYEMQGRSEDAIAAYLAIVFQYEEEVSQGKLRDWFYLARSGYDAARLMELQGGQSNIWRAARVYERLARTGIPTAGEALKKAEDLRRTHNLSN